MIERKEYIAHPYQELITDALVDRSRSAVWASMGMGKTVSTLTALDSLHLAGDTDPVLIMGPLRVAKNVWPAEARKWKHLRNMHVMPIVGSEAERRAALKFDSPIYSVNYDNLPWLIDYWGERWPYRTVVSDEATRLKGFRLKQGGKRSAALGQVAHTKIKRFVELTGTPSPNGLQDLWGQMWFLDAGQRLGRTHESFMNRWFAYQRKPTDAASIHEIKRILMPYGQVEIQDLIRDLCLTVNAKDWFDLEDPIVKPVYIDLPPKARQLYDRMEDEMFMELESGHTVEAFNAAARTQKLLQIANGAAYVDPAADDDYHPRSKEWKEIHNEKIDALESIIFEAAGMPVLVAYQFRSDLARLLRAFPKGRVLDHDPKTETDWNAGRISPLFVHPKSAGHGLNLQDGGNILALFGHDWNLEDYMQMIERIGPMRQLQSGHDRNVWVYPIIARDTMDEVVMERRESKREVQDILLDAMKTRRKK